MPMLIDWPDRYWHTSADTLDNVDPTLLGKTAVLTAAYGYWLAVAGAEEAVWLGHEMATRFQARLARRAQDALGEALEAPSRLDVAKVWSRFLREASFLVDRYTAGLPTLRRLSPDLVDLVTELAQMANGVVQRETSRVRLTLMRQYGLPGLEDGSLVPLNQHEDWQEQAAHLVPQRLFRGPLALRVHLPKLTPEDRLAWYRMTAAAGAGWDTARRLAEYWADGQRTLLEIVQLVELESGQKRGPLLLQCFRYCEKMGLLRLVVAE
jgi:hypothetical protein